MVEGRCVEQLDLHHARQGVGSVFAEAVPAVVALLDAVFDGADFQRKGTPNAVVLLQQAPHGVVVVVCPQRHQGQDGKVVVAKPLHGTAISLSAPTQRHQLREPFVEQPSARLVLVVKGMHKQTQLRVAVPEQPIAKRFIAGNRFAPCHQDFDWILPYHE